MLHDCLLTLLWSRDRDQDGLKNAEGSRRELIDYDSLILIGLGSSIVQDFS